MTNIIEVTKEIAVLLSNLLNASDIGFDSIEAEYDGQLDTFNVIIKDIDRNMGA